MKFLSVLGLSVHSNSEKTIQFDTVTVHNSIHVSNCFLKYKIFIIKTQGFQFSSAPCTWTKLTTLDFECFTGKTCFS